VSGVYQLMPRWIIPTPNECGWTFPADARLIDLSSLPESAIYQALQAVLTSYGPPVARGGDA
jgi:hypothetical protein